MNRQIVREHWGANAPDWIKAIAKNCDETSQTRVARLFGCSPAVINQTLRNRYPGDMARIAEVARSIYLSSKVDCPVLGPISRSQCEGEQVKEGRTSSPIRARLYRACRNGCAYANKVPR